MEKTGLERVERNDAVLTHMCQGCAKPNCEDLKIARLDNEDATGYFWLCPKCRKEENEDPSFPKQEPFYCCVCKKNTDGLSTCHLCGHMKGRWKTDKHHCEPSQEFIKEQRGKLNKQATQEFHKLLVKSKELGFH